MRRALTVLLAGCIVVASSCTGTPAPASSEEHRLVLLTRDGCITSATMRDRLVTALSALGRTDEFQVVDQGNLAATDFRIGYPTPTLLYGNNDVFGMKRPTPPFPEPT